MYVEVKLNEKSIELRRLAALHRLAILDTKPEHRYDRLVNIAHRFYDVPYAIFILVDEDRQWFKSKCGTETTQSPSSHKFGRYTIEQDKVFVVEDASSDSRFHDNICVTGSQNVRFYAGIPVREPGGYKVGALCIIDTAPREIAEADLDVLRSLASLLEEELAISHNRAKNSALVPVSQINRAIHRAQHIFHTNDDDQGAFELALNDLLVLTDSQFGMIGEVESDSRSQRYLRVAATSNIELNAETREFYKDIRLQGMGFDQLGGLFGSALDSDDVFIVNDAQPGPNAYELPAGHPSVSSFLCIPLYSGTNRVGLVGLANRITPYSELLAIELAPLLQTLGQLIEHRQLHKERLDHHAGLELAANFDALTGLPNRRSLMEMFENELAIADVNKGEVSICFIDLDGFKGINDTHGHSVGDSVLRVIADRLKLTLRDCDIVARLGGDEFVAVIAGGQNNAVFDRMLEAIRQPIQHDEETLHLAGSMGVTVYPIDDSQPDLLLRHADQAMYKAKELGKNRYFIFDVKTHFKSVTRGKLVEQIAAALEQSQLELYLQPKIDLQNNVVEGFESLLRWNHPEDGVMAPLEFLPQLESTELATSVGNFVIADAIAKLKAWDELGFGYSLSINLSPTHLLSSNFVGELTLALDDCSEALRSRLVIELLETTALNDTRKVTDVLAECRKLGVQISLDDFGTGYSSLEHFRRLPANEIKIDRSFIADMLIDPGDEMIVKSIIELSKNFDRRVVAEGIENKEMQDRLIKMGCHVGQGFFYTKALPEGAALAWAKQYE